MILCMSLFAGLKWTQWIGLSSSKFGETSETKGYLRSIDSLFFYTNQDCILIIQNINFSKVLCNPKLRWHLTIICTYQLAFIFVFENVTRHFGFEVERQMKFVKHTHCSQHKMALGNDGGSLSSKFKLTFENQSTLKFPIKFKWGFS